MHVAQFVQRYPPALGGSEAYTARLCEYLAARGDHVTVWTSRAVELSEMWSAPRRAGGVSPPSDRTTDSPHSIDAQHRIAIESVTEPPHSSDAEREVLASTNRLFVRSGDLRPPLAEVAGHLSVVKYPPLHFPARRYVLKALSLLPHRCWQCLTTPCNPVCPAMWRDAHRYDGPLDAVHATAFPYSFPILCGLGLARRRGVPFLLTPFLHLGDPHDPHDTTRKQYTKPHLRWLLNQADRVFVQTGSERDAAVSLGVRPERVVLQGLGVGSDECTGGNREATRKDWGVARNEVVIGHLANNSIEKGTVDLLRAAERAWAAGHQFRVVLAGPEMPNFRSFWEDFGPKARVTRLGALTDEQKRDFFAGIDVFALPSRCDSFGLVLLEAWANGKPNVVYRAGGPADLVRHEVDGLQATCGAVAELAAQIGRLAADGDLRRRLGRNGSVRVAHEFRWNDKLALVRETIRASVTSAAVRQNPRRRWASSPGAARPARPRPDATPARTSVPK
ncbi:glycosyltransferase family 4 protein [Frigoriglobus tundricola]|uniref:glycosyltransferase family 4 protein n=1 Tax=Frigoriglobus tundricola TaxID=2774151 RepID=UPI00148EB3FB